MLFQDGQGLLQRVFWQKSILVAVDRITHDLFNSPAKIKILYIEFQRSVFARRKLRIMTPVSRQQVRIAVAIYIRCINSLP